MDADAEPVTPEVLADRAATVDERLSGGFESLPGLKRDADRAAKRLAAWCSSSASGDWELFDRRLRRDGNTVSGVLARFATARRSPSAALPEWCLDADWIQLALRGSPSGTPTNRAPFEHVFISLVEEADNRLWDSIDASVAERFTPSARADLRGLLIDGLSGLCAPALYDRFTLSATSYADFVSGVKTGGLSRLFGDKPVLLRLVATLIRQWYSAAGEFVTRLDQDLERVQHDILHGDAGGRVVHVEGGLSDPHCGGRSVLRVRFESGACVMYKPKDLRLDVAWHSLVERLNCVAPVQLRAAVAIAGDGYGWTEFVDHTPCDDAGCGRFFRRAGAWLALFHCFAAGDIHHENLVAAGDHPVPIDVETLLQAAAADVDGVRPDAQAYQAARELIADSVTAVGLLPAYGKSATGVYSAGGVVAEWPTGKRLIWDHLNTDAMRPSMVRRQAGPPRICRASRTVVISAWPNTSTTSWPASVSTHDFSVRRVTACSTVSPDFRSGRSFGPPSSTRCC